MSLPFDSTPTPTSTTTLNLLGVVLSKRFLVIESIPNLGVSLCLTTFPPLVPQRLPCLRKRFYIFVLDMLSNTRVTTSTSSSRNSVIVTTQTLKQNPSSPSVPVPRLSSNLPFRKRM